MNGHRPSSCTHREERRVLKLLRITLNCIVLGMSWRLVCLNGGKMTASHQHQTANMLAPLARFQIPVAGRFIITANMLVPLARNHIPMASRFILTANMLVVRTEVPQMWILPSARTRIRDWTHLGSPEVSEAFTSGFPNAVLSLPFPPYHLSQICMHI